MEFGIPILGSNSNFPIAPTVAVFLVMALARGIQTDSAVVAISGPTELLI